MMRGSPIALLLLLSLSGCADPRGDLDELAREPATCSTSAECCVVVDPCMAEAWVVGSADYDRARELRDELDDSPCARCVTPAVEVACVEGRCVGKAIDLGDDPPQLLFQDHCGAILEEPPAPHEMREKTTFGCGG